MTQLVHVRGLKKVYGAPDRSVTAVDDVDMDVSVGEAVAIMGPSGCGKSTLLAMLGLMLRPSSARQLTFDGTPVPEGERDRAGLRNTFIGFVSQGLAMVDDEDVQQNVAISLEYAKPRVSRRQKTERVSEALDKVGLKWALSRRAKDLSGGEKQRVAISRALINSPRLLIADEPTAALDSKTAADVVTLLLSVRTAGASLVLATHDENVAGRCDRVLRMRDGRWQTS